MHLPGTPLLAAFDQQARWCHDAGATFTARMLARSRRWLSMDPTGHAALHAFSDEPLAAAVPLRWAGALHHLALRGLSPWAGLWPAPAAGQREHLTASEQRDAATDIALDADLDDAIATAWRQHQPHLRRALARAPQTNEVQRSAVLLPGLLQVAARTGLPLALFEIGASAGLNLWCERWRFEFEGWRWGDAIAPLVLHSTWSGAAPPATPLRVLRRAGCDLHPVDLRQADERLRLASFVWPDQPERMQRLARATSAASGWMRDEGVVVQACTASAFAAQVLAAPRRGQATVLMHSIMWQYLPADEQQAVQALVEAAGQRASANAPLAWLRFEPPASDQRPELRCRLWPGGEDQLLARAHAHVRHIEWLA
jgi:hypothetical protein